MRLGTIHRRLLAGSLALFLIGGCAWIPSGGQRAEFTQTPPDMAQKLSAVRGDESLKVRPSWPNNRWWLQFGSSELNYLMDMALKDNPGVKAAAARLREAEGFARVEGARLLPFLDAEAEVATARFSEYSVNVALRGAHTVSALINPFSLRYEFDFWGKNRAALEAALGEAAAEEAELAKVRLQLTAAIARCYFRGVALRQQLDLAEEMVGLRRQLLELARTRYDLGLDSADPVKQAETELQTASKRHAATRDYLDLQRNLLARLIGRGPDATQHLFNRRVNLPERIPLPEKLPLELLAHRPDLAAALHRAEAAAQRIKVAKASFYPTVDLTAFVGFNALRMTKGASSLANILFSGNSFAYGVAPGVRLPIFEGGRLRGQLSVQRAEYDEAVELYNKTLLQAIQEVADSLSNWRDTQKIVEAQNRLLTSQREALDLALERLRSGLDDRRAVLARQHAVLDHEYALKTFETDQYVAMTDLIEALGGGYSNGLDATRLQPMSD
ncbi:efflux transporter outer membrane subunit [Methylocaldum szegediense]|uniref:NodT family efflux transporter outer membrane factor (OMF) lipoprotein n=1 Tax=Methylocaldum szegediense TaxID=73780 RepID=A0ABN8X8U0_9GAMM|nr:efflux transporter outer membrane subunit [Methylocaldum szegediense]CAI8948620.1 NodT family efflux transporter outer membrane factor (OMF) lipoprotein [Methylocaldum szegediense]